MARVANPRAVRVRFGTRRLTNPQLRGTAHVARKLSNVTWDQADSDTRALELLAKTQGVPSSKLIATSGPASPRGGTTAARSGINDCASALISKPIYSPSRSKKAEATGSRRSERPNPFCQATFAG